MVLAVDTGVCTWKTKVIETLSLYLLAYCYGIKYYCNIYHVCSVESLFLG